MMKESSRYCRRLNSSSNGRNGENGENNKKNNGFEDDNAGECKSFGEKCNNLVKKQRTKFYILRRCIAMLVCWRDRGES
ncbi:small polypeptide DEVIL 16 [Cucumis melo]|uniref:Small polypeptide DEVIL 16 n=1 Tax=Cucumis melo TaxID=3656 RepID=A0A1S3B7W9_CUCME|nr:small polypeptide DEVIL 16 [Cucumis melo]